MKKTENYINLEKIPNYIASPSKIDIKSAEIINENNYYIYKYVPIKNIDILLTNAHRLDEPSKKLENMNTLSYYLDKNNKEEYNTLKNILENTNIEDIKKIENNQKSYKKDIPKTIKYSEDYLWQVFYIKRTDKYYMIVPVQETKQQAFLYLLHKKIKNSTEKIYIPICNGTYENEFVDIAKIKEFENGLYFFTKNWPTIFEYKNSKEDIIITIIGKTKIFENIISDYKMEFTDKKTISEFYNLIKTLLYIQTELPNTFKFNIFIDKDGSIHFYYNNIELNTDNLKQFYSEEIRRNIKNIEEIDRMQSSLLNKVESLKIEERKLNKELIYKQKQISTFLECKKTFFGKIKLFFKHNKKNKHEIENEETHSQIEDTEAIKQEYNVSFDDVEDLIYICKELKTKTNSAAITRMDIQNLTIKIDVLKKKIDNANAYINEIEAHKKSIFEFWKYTNKDEKAQLTEAEKCLEEQNKSIIEKNFVFDEDIKEFGCKTDILQNNILSEEEKNSVFLCTTLVFKDINNILNSGKTTSEIFEQIKQNNINYIKDKEYSHREKPRNLESILKILPNGTFDEYLTNIQNEIKNLNSALYKIKTSISLPVYSLNAPEKKLQIFELDPKKLMVENEEINLYKLIINRTSNAILFTNTIFFYNRHNTLEPGMDYSTKMLVDLRNINLIKIRETTNNIFYLEKGICLKLNIIEFSI